MPFPYFIRKLFQNDGAGDLLNKEIIPPSYVDTAAQTFTDEQKKQARTNIGATDADTVLNRSTSMLPYAFYNGEGRTVGELVTEMKKWVKATADKVPTAFTFNAGGAWINAWNTGNTSYVIPSGNSWAAVKIGFPFADYTALLISDYIENYLFYAIFQGGELKSIRPVVFSASNNAAPSCSSHVVSSYQAADGSLWYRKYSDGWIEQGGNPGGVGNMGTMDTTITFPVPFTNTNYFIGGVGFVIANVGSSYISSATTTGFTTSSVMHKSGTPSWYACGY